jgi:hypothetical protein
MNLEQMPKRYQSSSGDKGEYSMKTRSGTKSTTCEHPFFLTFEVACLYLSHARADYADDSSIRELLLWNHPHVSLAGSLFEFTEDERLTMLRLPRKDCVHLH